MDGLEIENRLYQCESCKKFDNSNLFIPAQCRCGGRVVELDAHVSVVASPTSRPNLTDKQRREIFEYYNGVCHISNRLIDPVRDDWEIEHVVPIWAGGANDLENMRPALQEFHKEKTAEEATQRAKGNRIINKHNGFHRAKRPVMGSKKSGWKKSVSGEVSRR